MTVLELSPRPSYLFAFIPVIPIQIVVFRVMLVFMYHLSGKVSCANEVELAGSVKILCVKVFDTTI